MPLLPLEIPRLRPPRLDTDDVEISLLLRHSCDLHFARHIRENLVDAKILKETSFDEATLTTFYKLIKLNDIQHLEHTSMEAQRAMGALKEVLLKEPIGESGIYDDERWLDERLVERSYWLSLRDGEKWSLLGLEVEERRWTGKQAAEALIEMKIDGGTIYEEPGRHKE